MHTEELFRGYMLLEKSYDRIDMLDEVLDKFVSTLDKNQLRLFKILKREYNFFYEYDARNLIKYCCAKIKNTQKIVLVSHNYFLRNCLNLRN